MSYLLEVVLHLVDRSHLRGRCVLAELAFGLSLAQQVPALVELRLDLAPPRLPLISRFAVAGELMLLGDQLADPREDVVIHGASMRLAR